MQLLLHSFGFKQGITIDADFIFDIRCLPNPYWNHNLKDLSGLDGAVIEYLDQQPLVQRMLNDICSFLEDWIPQFEAHHRNDLTIAIGCTGGQHRSVYMVESLAKRLQPQIRSVSIKHCGLTPCNGHSREQN